MDVRAEGGRLPPRTARAPEQRRRRDRQLGLRNGNDLLRKGREAGHARSLRLSDGAGRDANTFLSRTELQGTRDPAAWLAVPDAIRFQVERDWDEIRRRCRRLTLEAREQLCSLLGTEPLAPDEMLAQMAAVRLPESAPALSDELFARHRVEIPVGGTQDDLLRLSVAAYTTREEIDRLLAALVRELDPEEGQQDE